MKRAANFSVSVCAASRALMHFFTGSARFDFSDRVDSEGVGEEHGDMTEAILDLEADVEVCSRC